MTARIIFWRKGIRPPCSFIPSCVAAVFLFLVVQVFLFPPITPPAWADNPVGPLPTASGFALATVAGETGLWTGAATARIPIDVPAGPGGLAPNLALSYSSDAVVDATYKEAGKTNTKHDVQASPVGYGWDLQGIPVIARVPAQKDFNDICWGYEVHLNGTRFRLAHRGGEPQVDTTRITRYESDPQNFIEAREYETYEANPLPDKQDCTNYIERKEHKWVLKTADGTEYTFGGLRADLPGPDGQRDSMQEMNAYGCRYVLGNRVCYWFPIRVRWYATKIRDTHSNEILFAYRRESALDKTAAQNRRYDTAVTIDTIRWGAPGDPGFQVQFIPEAGKRPDCIVDNMACGGEASGAYTPIFRSEYRIKHIEVSARNASGWTVLRDYMLDFQNVGAPWSATAHSLLTQVTLKPNKDSGTYLPPYVMFYENQGGAFTNWAPLKTFESGYGAKAEYIYSGEFTFKAGSETRTRRRVDQTTIYDRTQIVSQTGYLYSAPAGSKYYSSSYGGGVNNGWYEFLGHREVTETLKDAAGNVLRQVTGGFVQGTGAYRGTDNPEPHPARGQVLSRAIKDASGTILYSLENVLNSVPATVLPGWSSWAGCTCTKPLWGRLEGKKERWDAGRAWESSRGARFGYEPPQANDGQTHGNVTETREYASLTDFNNNLPYRTERKWYFPNTADHILDRVAAVGLYAGGGWTGAFYIWNYFDGNTSHVQSPGPKAELTRVARLQPLAAYPGCGYPSRSSEVAYGYDARGNRTTETTYTDYGTVCQDPYGNIIGRQFPTQGETTQTTYDDYLFRVFPIQVKNAANQVTSYYYYGVNGPASLAGSFGKLERMTDPNPRVSTSYRYDAFGRLTKVIKHGDTEDIPTIQHVYDDFYGGAAKRIQTYYREVSGNAHLFRPVLQFYDGLGRLVQTKEESQDGTQMIVSNLAYDARGLKVREYVPYFRTNAQDFWEYVAPDTSKPKTTFTYDALGRIRTVSGPDNNTTWRAYRGWQSAVVDGNGHQKIEERDPFGRLITVKEFTGKYPISDSTADINFNAAPYATTRYQYDLLDKLTDVGDARDGYSGNFLHITYDFLGRKVQMRDPDLGTWGYDYDGAGNLTRQTDARGQTTCMYYDPLHRLTGKVFQLNNPNCSPTDPGYNGYAAKFRYDQTGHAFGIGRRTQTQTTGIEPVTVDFEYDPRGRLWKEKFSINGAPSYEIENRYDAMDRLVRQRYPDGEWVQTDYTPGGQPRALHTPDDVYGIKAIYVADTTYNAAGQIKSRTLGQVPGLTTRFGYFTATGLGDDFDQTAAWGANSFGRLYRICSGQAQECPANSGGALAIQDLRYLYDNAGNVAYIRDYGNGNQVQFFAYDELDRLKHACTLKDAGDPCLSDVGQGSYDINFNYDRIGNLTYWSSHFEGVELKYLDPGHKHAATHRGNTQVYRYDANGNMTSGAGAAYHVLNYDAENRLASVADLIGGRPVNGVTFAYDADGRRVKRYDSRNTVIYVGDLFEKNLQTGEITKYYFLGGKRVAMRKGPAGWEKLHYLFGDHLGSTGASYDVSYRRASVVRYYPWGGTRTGSVPTDRMFTGQRFDTPIALYDFGARYYDPNVGRFIQPDTIVPSPGNPADLNRYSYVRNNPLRYSDPTGHWVESAVDIAFLAFDLYDIKQNGLTVESGLALAADVVSLALPVVAGGGVLVRAALHSDDAVRAATHLGRAAHGLHETQGSIHAAKSASQLGAAASITNKATIVHDLSSGTVQSRRIAEGIEQGRVGVNILGDELFGRTYRHYGGRGSIESTDAFAVQNQIYLRRSSQNFFRDAVHEGTHALDYLDGIRRSKHLKEKRAYYFERQFQLWKGRPTEFGWIPDIGDHVRRNY